MKKNHYELISGVYKIWKSKFFRKMRIVTLLILISITQTFALDAYAQNKRLNLNVKNETIVNILEKIEDQSEFYFMFDASRINVDQRRSVDCENQLITNILDQLFENTGITFSIKDRQVLLTTAEKYDADQQKSISGIVTDASGLSLPGVTVIIKGTTNGTVTNNEGRYTIQNIPEDATLMFSFVGMRSQEIAIGTNTTIDVTMEEDAIGIEEVVAIGYGVQKKTTLTGSISTIKGEELTTIPVSNVSQSIAGKLAGVSMIHKGGQPGFDSPEIQIRGIVTTGNSSPLIVIDGIKRDNMKQINPNTIESITILKDAAAVAPYGIGGANGVILIITKKGLKEKPVVRLNSSFGINRPTRLPDMLNAKDYMALQNESYFNLNPNGTTPPYEADFVDDYNNLHASDPYRYPNSNFVDAFQLNVPTQNHNIELSGGTDIINYHAGLGFYDQKGMFDATSYKRYNYNLSLELKATKTTKVGISLLGSVERTNTFDPGEENLIFRTFYKFIPTEQLIYPDGKHWGTATAVSPYGILNSDGYEKIDNNTLLGTVYIEQQIPFIQGLSMKGVFSYDPSQQYTKKWHLPFVHHTIDLTTTPYSYSEAISTHLPYRYLEIENARWQNLTYQFYLNYNRTFGNHSITGLFVAEGREYFHDNFSARRNNFAIDIDEMDLGSSNKMDYDNGGISSSGSELGYVYRLGYSFKDKYIFEASGRYDGHYYFAPGKRWAYFPSFSAAWRISEESFAKEFENLDNLKLRGSWGKSGMLAGSPFQYLEGYILRGNAYALGSGNLVQGSSVPSEANPNITWEKSTKFDIGFDLNMWSGLLNVEFDYFHEDRTGMLLPPQVTVPEEYGLDFSEENKGAMKNNGFEIIIGTHKKLSNGMVLGINGNLSFSKNKMVEVFETDAERNNPNRTKYGRPYQTPFGYKSLGLFSTADDINSDGIINSDDGYNIVQFGELHPGDIKYADLSGPNGTPDGVIDANDLTSIGHPYYPALTYGFTTTMDWKGIDINLFFQGSGMSSIDLRQFQTVPFYNASSNTSYEYLDNRWTPENQDSKYPRATPSPYANNSQKSDFWQFNTGFLRLKNMTIGYTIPNRIVERINIGSMRLYFTGQNLLTFSKIKFVDPELQYNPDENGERDRESDYPVMKSFNLGVDITF